MCMLLHLRPTKRSLPSGNCHNAGTSSLLPRWRDDASQVICTFYYDFLDGAQISCLILRHLLESFFYYVKSPFRGFHFSSKSALVFFPVPLLSTQGKPVSSFCGYNQYHCSTSLAPSTPFPGWRFMLPLALYSCLPFFLSILSKPFNSCSSSAEMCPHDFSLNLSRQ